MTDSSISRKGSVDSFTSQSSNSTSHTEMGSLLPALTGHLAWRGEELNPKQYVLHLAREEIDAVKASIISFKLTGLPYNKIAKETFPLPESLIQRLSGISKSVHNGIGVAVLRGLHDARLNDDESVIAFAGIASHVCPERATDAYANQTLSHIRDATHDNVPDWARDIGLAGSKLPVAMEFHADRFSGDVLALYVRNSGGEENGGDQYLASFWSIYNELLVVAPDVLETLASADWPFELKDPVGNKPYLQKGPIIFFSEGRVISQLVRAPLLGSPRIPRSARMPKLSSQQMHALQMVEDTARRLNTKLDRVEGDIQFINNLGILHARSAYANPGQKSTRHLLRMFLRDSRLAWAKPLEYVEKFNDSFDLGRPQNFPVIDSDPWRKVSGYQSHG